MSTSLDASAAARADEWSRVSNRGGVLVEKRGVPGSSYYEYRASADAGASPERIFGSIWNPPPDAKMAHRFIASSQVLRESPVERVVYEQVKTSWAANRDYTVRLWHEANPQAHAYRVEFQTDNSLGPPETKGFVRIQRIHGEWVVSPNATGGAHVVFTIHSEPGGSIPAFLVRGAQADNCRDLFTEVVELAIKHPELSLDH